MNDVIELIQSHRSIRKFLEEPIEQNIINQLIESGQAAATSSFIQACTVIQVNDKENRSKLATYAGGQRYVESAPVFLVFCADMQRHLQACQKHQEEMQSGFTEQFLTTSLDCGLFAQNVAIAAESLGYGVVYIGGIRNKIEAVSDLLSLPDLVYPVFGMCIGRPDQNPEVKPRLPLSMVLKQDYYNNQNDTENLENYDAEIRKYYKTRTEGQKEMSWSEQISGMMTKEARPHMKPFLQEKGFILK